MLTINQIKLIASLQQSKFRQKYNKFIVEGDKIAQEILRNSTYKIETIYSTKDWMVLNNRKLNDLKCQIIKVTSQEMSKISALSTQSPVLIVLDLPGIENISLPISVKNAIYLDDVQDPGNVGTIIRIADWFGIDAVIRSNGSADFFSPKVIQATMGSFLNVCLHTLDYEAIKRDRFTTVGTVMDGSSVHEAIWQEYTMLVLGNEGKGIKNYILEGLDQKVTIPGYTNRIADSLNVSIAAGIVCSMWRS